MKQCMRCGSILQDADTSCQRCGSNKFKPVQQRQTAQPANMGAQGQRRQAQGQMQAQVMQGQMQGQGARTPQSQVMQGQRPNQNPTPTPMRPARPNIGGNNQSMANPAMNNMNNMNSGAPGVGQVPNNQPYNMQEQGQNYNGQWGNNVAPDQSQGMAQPQQAKAKKSLFKKKDKPAPTQPADNGYNQGMPDTNYNQGMNNGNMPNAGYDNATMVNWLITLLILMVPIVNIVWLIKTILSKTESNYKKTFAQAYLVYTVAAAILSIILTVVVANTVFKPSSGDGVRTTTSIGALLNDEESERLHSEVVEQFSGRDVVPATEIVEDETEPVSQ